MGDAKKRPKDPSKENLGITDPYPIEDEKFNASPFHSFELVISKPKCEYNVKPVDALEGGKGKVSCMFQKDFIPHGNEVDVHPKVDSMLSILNQIRFIRRIKALAFLTM